LNMHEVFVLFVFCGSSCARLTELGG